MEEEMALCNSLPLYEKIVHKSTLYRVYAFIHSVLLMTFLIYRLLHPIAECYGLWILAFASELFLAVFWVLNHNLKWVYIDYTTYPERLEQRYGGECDGKLPSVDVIITTTDPYKEPILMTANTVLSVLALDYPVEKLACYVSDDGASPITFYSLVQTLRFAKKWVPFCRKFNVETRSPFMYFSKHTKASDPNFLQEWQDVKEDYERLEKLINQALETGQVPPDLVSQGCGFAFKSSEIRNHASIVQILHENKKAEGNYFDVVPHLIYVAREKRPKLDHHYKAGAMNVMARVSGLMTNAPFILNLDCDMHVSNPKAIKNAMCFFLDCPSEKECGFVQFPQLFYGGLEDDPFGNQYKIFMRISARGMNGIQGPFYMGTCCFHRRKGLYGAPPATNQEQIHVKEFQDSPSYLSDGALRTRFGESSALVASAQKIISGSNIWHGVSSPAAVVDEALQVSSCSYENHTVWGKEVGWIYGATTEDIMTALNVQTLGWKSIYCTPEKPAFMGCAPGNGPDTLVQMKRWVTGWLEVFISKLCPFLGWNRPLSLRQRMVYALFNLYAIWSLSTLCYAVLPAFCLLSGKSFLPKIMEPAFSIAVALFLSVYGFGLWEYIANGCSAREWWNNYRMWLILCVSSLPFALFDVAMKTLGFSETVFVVTPKGPGDNHENGNQSDFTFDASPLFIPPTAVLLLNLTAILQSTIAFLGGRDEIMKKQIAEFFCSLWVVMNLLPFLKGLVRKGKHGIPWTVIIKSSALVLLLWSALC